MVKINIKGINNSSSLCGTPFYNNLDSGILNLYQNGNTKFNNFLSNKFEISNTMLLNMVRNFTKNDCNMWVI